MNLAKPDIHKYELFNKFIIISILLIVTQLQFVAKSFVLRREASILSNYLPPKRTRVPHSDKEYANNND